MSFFSRLFGPSDAKKQQALDKQMSDLERYIANNEVQSVQDDPNNPFVKCGGIENEHKYRRDMKTQLAVRPNDPALKAQKEQLLHKEFFLKVGQDKFVSLGNTDFLEFNQAHISDIIGLNSTSSDYKQEVNKFMNNYLYSRTAPTTVNPEKDETNTLLKTFLRAANQITDKRKAKEEAEFLSSQREQRYQRRLGESDDDFYRRIKRIEKEKAYEALIHPGNCRQNFTNFLKTPVNAIIGIGERHRGKTRYSFLVDSLGSIEGGFDKQYRTQTKFLDYGIDLQEQMAKFAQERNVQQGFIDTLCVNGNARKILSIANTEDIGGGQSYNQTSQGDDIYSKNVWKALRLCLECLEEYILNEYIPQLPNVPNEESPPPPPPPSGNIVGGGKSKSRSKSIRKKRISHRKKKSHSHKRRALKRRAVN
jgi:hypothetical protein